MNDIDIDAIEAVILRTKTLPEQILHFYRDLPGMSPSDHSKEVADILEKLQDEEAIVLLRDIVDSTIFSLLHLFDLDFMDRHIHVSFTRQQNPDSAQFGMLLDAYRERVDPGGKIVGQNYGDSALI